MENKIIIREARKEDCREIRNLIQELADFQKQPNAPQIDHTVLEKDGFETENPLFYAFVAAVDEKLIGYALYFYTYSTWEGKMIYLEDLYVKSDYRKKGIGGKLIRAVAERALKNGCKRLDLSVRTTNSAQDFYFKQGAIDLTKQYGCLLFRLEHDALKKLCPNYNL